MNDRLKGCNVQERKVRVAKVPEGYCRVDVSRLENFTGNAAIIRALLAPLAVWATGWSTRHTFSLSRLGPKMLAPDGNC